MKPYAIRITQYIAFLALVSPLFSAQKAKPAAAPEESYMSMYMGDQKIGYASFVTRPTKWEGKRAYSIESTNLIRANILGQKMEETDFTKQISDEKWAPKQLIFTQNSGGRTSSLVADFFADRIECKQVTAQRTTTKTVAIPKGVSLVADHQALMQKQSFKPGDKIAFHEFNPALLTIDRNLLEAGGKEEIEIRGKKQKAQLLKHTAFMPTGSIETKMWVDTHGDPLKIVTVMNLTLIREPKALAEKMPDGAQKPLDIAFATSIRTAKPVNNPREVKYLKLKVTGVSGIRDLPEDAHLKLTRALPLTSNAGTLEVTASNFDAARAATLPLPADQRTDFLKDGPYVEASDEAVRKQATEIVGDEKNAYKAAMKIRDWVHKRIHWQANIGVIRSAVDILKDPTGVCRDAAVLYTALARAAGLPTRIAAGLAYAPAPEAGFFGHAWAETWVGSEWVPFDPTLGEGFVDATHIKLGQGEYTCFFGVVQGLGGLKFEVVEFR